MTHIHRRQGNKEMTLWVMTICPNHACLARPLLQNLVVFSYHSCCWTESPSTAALVTDTLQWAQSTQWKSVWNCEYKYTLKRCNKQRSSQMLNGHCKLPLKTLASPPGGGEWGQLPPSDCLQTRSSDYCKFIEKAWKCTSRRLAAGLHPDLLGGA